MSKKVLFAILIVIVIVGAYFLFFGGTEDLEIKPDLLVKKGVLDPSQPAVSASRLACDKEIYSLGKRTNQKIETANQAFDIVREYWWTCVENKPQISECIPKNMTGEEALESIYLEFLFTTIELDNKQTIQAWTLNDNFALDKSGNIYALSCCKVNFVCA